MRPELTLDRLATPVGEMLVVTDADGAVRAHFHRTGAARLGGDFDTVVFGEHPLVGRAVLVVIFHQHIADAV